MIKLNAFYKNLALTILNNTSVLQNKHFLPLTVNVGAKIVFHVSSLINAHSSKIKWVFGYPLNVFSDNADLNKIELPLLKTSQRYRISQ